MNKNNPAVYQCPKAEVHNWTRLADATAECVNCKVKLTKEQAAECFDTRGYE